MKQITLAVSAILVSMTLTASTGAHAAASLLTTANTSARIQPSAAIGPDTKEALQRSFQKDFPNAENVHWGENNDGYNVTFTVKSILTRITYDKDGKFTGSLRNYSEQLLPFYLTNQLKKRYPGQDIYGITEIASPSEVTYYVKLQSAKSWTTVRIDNDGMMSVVEKYGRDN